MPDEVVPEEPVAPEEHTGHEGDTPALSEDEHAAVMQQVHEENKVAPVPEKPQEDTPNLAAEKPALSSEKQNPFKRLVSWSKTHKKISIPLAILLLLGLLLGVPQSRYPILGTFLKKDYKVIVLDSSTNKPVSQATVSLDGKTATTNNEGKATIKAKVGKKTVKVNKKYYKDASAKTLVGITNKASALQVKLEATGRQVPVTVRNKISGAVLANILVKAADTEAKTDKDGKVTIVLPADKSTVDATLSGDGYNENKVKIQVTDQETKDNAFQVTPAGKVYFLSKLSGKIDVVKTDLDGQNRQTVLAGTGNEADSDTILLASRDWKYLALKAKRDSEKPKLYLIETANDKLTTIDEGDADFTLTGWAGQYFAYQVARNTIKSWEPKRLAIKSYNAAAKTLATLDETQATGDQNNFAAQDINWVYIVDNSLVYFKSWFAQHANASVSFPELADKQAQLATVPVDGSSSKKTIRSYEPSSSSKYQTTYYAPLQAYDNVLYAPGEIYFSVTGYTVIYSEFDRGQLEENSAAAETYFQNRSVYPTYILSPDGKKTFWTEARDGKNRIFVGTNEGKEGKQIASLDEEYTPYGWYSDNYLLVSKKGSELYILPATGVADANALIKISDYHKPAYNFQGYGGGYGGF